LATSAPSCTYETFVALIDSFTYWLPPFPRHRYFGNVVGVERLTNTQTCNIRIQFDEFIFDTFEYPSLDVERLATSRESLEHYPEKFIVGDVVDGLFQDGRFRVKWHRGRVAVVDEEEGTCNIMYYDGDVSDAITCRPYFYCVPMSFLM